MPDIIRIQIMFTAETPYGTFTDCLYKTQAEYDAADPATIEAEKQARIAAYVAAIQNPIPPVEPDP